MTSIFKENNCPVCGSDQSIQKFVFNYSNNILVQKLNYLGDLPKVKNMLCSICDHNYATPIVDPSIMEDYYNKINSTFYKSEAKVVADPLLKENSIILDLVRNELDIHEGSVLEIGCGRGFLLKIFKDQGWNVSGVEPSTLASTYANEILGVDVKNSFLDYNSYDGASFDLIMLFDVVEHIPSMEELMNLVKYYLKPGGHLIIKTGNIDSLTAKINRETWAYFGSWEHVSFFNTRSIKYLLTKYDLETKKILNVSHSKSKIINCKQFLQNIFIFRPLNLLIPSIVRFFPARFLCKIFGDRSFIQSGVVTSRLSFDHIIVVGKLKDGKGS